MTCHGCFDSESSGNSDSDMESSEESYSNSESENKNHESANSSLAKVGKNIHKKMEKIYKFTDIAESGTEDEEN